MPRRPRRWRHLDRAPWLPALAAVLAGLALFGCHRHQGSGPGESELPAPSIDHGPPPAFAGTWVGPELRLSFVGPWVLVSPTDDPTAAPIEMRVLVERHEGDAFALRTTLAGVFAADFLRPDDWTMLVEGDELAIAMGDEPLTTYAAAPEAPALLLGPTMVEAETLPEHLVRADVLTCLEHAAHACAALEGGAGPVAGCRELHWGDCIRELGPPPADPVERARETVLRSLRRHLRALAFTRAVERAHPEQAQARELYDRALAAAADLMTKLEAEDQVPEIEEVARIRQALGAHLTE